MGLNRTLRNAYHRLAAGGQLRTIPGETVSRMKADLSLSDSDSLATETLGRSTKSWAAMWLCLALTLIWAGKSASTFGTR